MATAITVFTIITGMASLLGFAFQFFKGVTPGYKRLCASSFAFATLWSLYVLFVPNTTVKSNVAEKISYYKTPSVEREGKSVMIQRGELAASGNSSQSVEFPIPFADTPSVEIINIKGRSDFEIPKITSVTSNQFIYYRGATSEGTFVFLPNDIQTFKWVARGTPLEEERSTK